MTRDDIIRLAKAVRDGGHWNLLDIINFANLVAAAEREACAMEAEYEAARWSYNPEVRKPCKGIAKAIRARGEK